ncbi:MAG TPA: CAP domain-containing protein [Candidatus Paceibacterota bacterium]|nr:CAP domain-containing protein [Candidatus Paceibacterota bacterium]
MNFSSWVTKIILFIFTSVVGVFSPGIVVQVPTTSFVATSTIDSNKTSDPTNGSLAAPLTPKTPITTNQAPKAAISQPIVKIAPKPSALTPSKLDALEIIVITNQERAKDGAQALTWNPKLAEEALAKAKDMIAKQYFAHKSPDGVNVSDLAAIHGYAYSLVGENLALGDFKSSSDVMDGWMNSPGHRANILKKAYTEIGVAAIMGAYEGRQVWYAVQEFGRPPPDCALPDPKKETLIKNSEAKLDELTAQLNALKATIDAGTASRAETNAAIEQYNTTAGQHNDLLVNLKGIITAYNDEVSIYNACLAKEEAIVGPPSAHPTE